MFSTAVMNVVCIYGAEVSGSTLFVVVAVTCLFGSVLFNSLATDDLFSSSLHVTVEWALALQCAVRG